MARIRFIDVQARPVELLDVANLPFDEWQRLVRLCCKNELIMQTCSQLVLTTG
jgi:hypothetical protein